MGYYIISGLQEDDRTKVIAGRPRRLGNNPILLQTWIPFFDPIKESNKMVTTLWMTIKNLPIKFHTPQILIEIGNAVGKQDGRNVDHSCLVRVCTEVDLSNLLPQKIVVNGRPFHLFPFQFRIKKNHSIALFTGILTKNQPRFLTVLSI